MQGTVGTISTYNMLHKDGTRKQLRVFLLDAYYKAPSLQRAKVASGE